MKIVRVSGVVAASFVAVGLSLTGCSSDDVSDTASDVTSSAESVVAEATSTADKDASPTPSSEQGTPGVSEVAGPDGPVEVDPAIGAKYAELGAGSGYLGTATGPQESVGDGTVVPFDGGSIYSSPATGVHVVQGEILRVYTEQDGPAGVYGFPVSDETRVPGGWSSAFSGGTISWTERTPGLFAETLTPN